MDLTKEEHECNCETQKHIEYVKTLLRKCENILRDRGENHDSSKKEAPEVKIFTEMTPKLSGSTYGSDEYNGFLDQMKTALDHHYSNNSHHPEYYEAGIDGMDLFDILEMFCDWAAASKRHDDGNIEESINIGAKRFSITPQLVKILLNTVKSLGLK